ncbi:hypothetical protein NDU88_004116 [Pleurodeles waltl]|uniref:Uncharacterized protein n=1 Tax=Pleurodeles waltl TaxID=8319 RepID=A0AAV7SI14_PLEWA|nr:hypothetical protein NDU88_004116 [Pleurodeles waltl]
MACVSIKKDGEEYQESDGEHRGMVLSLKQGNVAGYERLSQPRFGNGMQFSEYGNEGDGWDQQEVVEDGSGEEESMQTGYSDVNVAVGDTSVASRVKSNLRARRQPTKFKDFV